MNEIELLKEIENLETKFNENELVCRVLNENDFDDYLVKWWAKWPGWPEPPMRDFLPDNGKGGLMIEKNGKPIVAGFLYQTNSKGILLEWIISDPDYREDDRDEAVEKLIIEAEKSAEEMGYIYMFTIGRQMNLVEKHKKLGWQVDDKPSHEIVKVIKSNLKKQK
jgi:hypothetical protein